ncbi:MAG: MetQ/NlpA family ABC transporter substrate-binding protein, partial [Clostridia bacterium]|nr:MetQ/NlpA family ABC transporter substrate-binding protein [Clostridia bacterium]
MKNKILSLALSAVIILSAGLVGCSDSSGSTSSAEGEPKKEIVTVKLGLSDDTSKILWDPIVEEFKEKDVNIEYVVFSDYTQPNAALANGEIDLNSFQHYNYLNNEKETFGYQIDAIGDTLITALNLYSKKISSIDELKEGDKIAVPNDAINERRALSVLQAAGLIKFDDTGDSVTKSSITENPKKLEIVEVDASQTASLLPDVAAALVNGGYSRDAGLKKSDVIFDDDINAYDPDVIHGYINVIV